MFVTLMFFIILSVISNGGQTISDGSYDFDDANDIDHHCRIKSQHVMIIFFDITVVLFLKFMT